MKKGKSEYGLAFSISAFEGKRSLCSNEKATRYEVAEAGVGGYGELGEIWLSGEKRCNSWHKTYSACVPIQNQLLRRARLTAGS